MPEKNSYEIISEFIQQAGFVTGYVEPNFPVYFPEFDLRFGKNEGANYLLGSATTGNKSIGFFHSPVSLKQSLALKSECVIITTALPEKLEMPIIFCKNIALLKDKLIAAIKVSAESKLPVMIVISDSVLFNYWDVDDFDFDNERLKPLLSKKTLDNKLSSEEYLDSLNVAEAVLGNYFSEKIFTNNRISFFEEETEFFDYLVPFVKSTFFKDIESKNVLCIKYKEKDFFRMVKLHYSLDLDFEFLEEKKNIQLTPLLCPGCPFVSIFNQLNISEYLVFSDINCESVYKRLNVQKFAPEFVEGMCRNSSSKCLYIGNISGFAPFYQQNAESLEVILLNDLQTKPSFLPIAKATKLQGTGVIFPYSCNNVTKKRQVKIAEKKCLCIKNNETVKCINSTNCPALYVKGDTVSVDNELCTGCRVCAKVCPYGAVK